ncbi:hypothetical protein OG723_44440 (plasmid) [Streptomyces sp. NBC_01278]|uniref:hypothetical protein n=1 Tax=Streptomyces sp. NBC_01278 TaxID=2903809 RepID=UPI002E334B22|nr:hypothetical protein [Streptomyces sp. NBC_01278]
MSTPLATPVRSATTLPLWDVFVSRKDLGPLPTGVDPAHVRVARADQVRGGDLVVGYFDQAPGGRWMPSAHVGELCYRALPALHPERPGLLSLDGVMFQWMAHDLLLIVPAGLAAETYRPGDRVERIATRRTGDGLTQRYAHHGTVVGVDDGTVTVRFDADWLPVTLRAGLVRRVDAESVAEDRAAYGCAHGDTVTLPWRPTARGTIVDLTYDLGTVTAYVVWETEAPSNVPVRDLRLAVPLPAAA